MKPDLTTNFIKKTLSKSQFHDPKVFILTGILSRCMYNMTNLTKAKKTYRTYLSSILRTDKLGSATEDCMSFIPIKRIEKNVKPMIHKWSSSNSRHIIHWSYLKVLVFQTVLCQQTQSQIWNLGTTTRFSVLKEFQACVHRTFSLKQERWF